MSYCQIKIRHESSLYAHKYVLKLQKIVIGMQILLDTDKKNIGQKIKFYRKLKKYTQSELAELVGLNEKQISRIEAGQNYPTYSTFVRLIQALDIDLVEFSVKNDNHSSYLEKELISLIKNSTEKELKIYLDVIKPLRKNLRNL